MSSTGQKGGACLTIKGAIHVHSRYSDGSGRVEDIIAAARAAGLDYLIITDHTDLSPEQYAFQGRHGDLLVLCGVEMDATRFGRRHFLALGIDSHLPYEGLSLQETLRRIEVDGGISIIAHPSGVFKPWLAMAHRRWKRFPEEHLHGLEIWTYMHDWVKNLRLTDLRRGYSEPDRSLTGPSRRLLAKWDAMNRKRRVAGIGSQDNHARYIPIFGARIFPYEYLFRRLLTHVEVEPSTGDAGEEIRCLLSAIAAGRSFFANHAVAAPEGFRFYAEGGGEHGVGSWLREKVRVLRVESPCKAEMTLVCDGRAVISGRSDSLELVDPPAGAYRVEARIDGVPWLFTNHINVAMPPSSSPGVV